MTDVRDFNIWNANKFTTDTAGSWTTVAAHGAILKRPAVWKVCHPL